MCLQSPVILLEPTYLLLHFFLTTLKVRFLKALKLPHFIEINGRKVLKHL